MSLSERSRVPSPLANGSGLVNPESAADTAVPSNGVDLESLGLAVSSWTVQQQHHLEQHSVEQHRDQEAQVRNVNDASAPLTPSEKCTLALEALVARLTEAHAPESLIADFVDVATTFTSLCGAEIFPPTPPTSNSGTTRNVAGADAPVSRRLGLRHRREFLRGFGLPVHETSIGRRASASYCVYERLGGWETLSAAVEALHSKLLQDTRVAEFLVEGRELGREALLKTHMLEFMSCAFGGKDRFASSQLLQTQRDRLLSIGFGAEHFDIMLQHLKAVLDDLSVPKEVAGSALSILRCNRYLFEPMPDEHGTVEVTAVAEPAAQA